MLDRGEAGAGEPTLLIHGFTGSHAAWGDSILEAVGRKGRLLAVDLPGHGESERSHDPGRYRIERVVADLVAVLDARGFERADWVGYSLGGRVALAAAVLVPERVRRLVLESSSPGIRGDAARKRRRRQDELLATRIEGRGIEWFVDYWMALPLFATQQRLPVEVLAAARRRRLENDPRVLAAILRGLGAGAQPSFWDRLGEVEAETLVLAGGLDRKYQEVSARMIEALPRAHQRTVSGVGHAVHFEDPARWIEEVMPFLRSW